MARGEPRCALTSSAASRRSAPSWRRDVATPDLLSLDEHHEGGARAQVDRETSTLHDDARGARLLRRVDPELDLDAGQIAYLMDMFDADGNSQIDLAEFKAANQLGDNVGRTGGGRPPRAALRLAPSAAGALASVHGTDNA